MDDPPRNADQLSIHGAKFEHWFKLHRLQGWRRSFLLADQLVASRSTRELHVRLYSQSRVVKAYYN